tara:strand:+ start:1191 stop:1517 length:327 start_codon:yes stop_codon:yes gene_type:complete
MNIPLNPKPHTNSEMDSKTNLTKDLTNLTDSQRYELTEQFVELVVDQMDLKTLVQIVSDNLIDYHNEGSLEELRDAVICYADEDLYDELVDNVTNETVLDINDTGGKY